MLKASFWAAIAAVALVGLSLSGGSVAFADPPCAKEDRPCPPGLDGTPQAGQGAQNAHNDNGGRHGVFGVVSGAINVGASGSFTLLTKQGSVTVDYDADTKCKVPGTKGPGENSDCDEILNGHYVSVQGTPDGDGIDAKRIHLNRGRSLHEHCRGEIQAITASSLTVRCATDSEGGYLDRTFTIDESTKFGPKGQGVDDWDDLDSPANQEVAVVAARDGLLASDLYTAKVVHKVAD